MLDAAPRQEKEAIAALLEERERRTARRLQAAPGGLLHFVRHFWPILEPQTSFVEGWAMEAICQHLEAVTFGEITRLLINVPPGFSKSLLTNVFWPAWEWAAMGKPHLRYVTFSYAAALTERDNRRFRDLMLDPRFQALWGDQYKLTKIGETLTMNDRTGWKLASSVGGVGTGERGDRVLLDDPHNIKEGESETIRDETVRWFRESMSNRLNDMERSAIVVIMQRVHEGDVSGSILEHGDEYVHLMIPMEYDPMRHCETPIGWSDPREEPGDLAWPERFPPHIVVRLQTRLGPYAYESQYQQTPSPRGGGIIKGEWWRPWPAPGYEEYEATDTRPARFPDFELVICSIDGAFTTKEENDWCACTTWGLWRDRGRLPKLMLVEAWRERYELRAFVEAIKATATKRKADHVLIENKASGISAAQELRRLTRDGDFTVHLVDPGDKDKAARLLATQPFFSAGMVYAPDRKWADMVIQEVAAVPKGRHDDLADTVSQALLWLRRRGIIQMANEYEADDLRLKMFQPKRELPYGL